MSMGQKANFRFIKRLTIEETFELIEAIEKKDLQYKRRW